jgi:hypothetical protein
LIVALVLVHVVQPVLVLVVLLLLILDVALGAVLDDLRNLLGAMYKIKIKQITIGKEKQQFVSICYIKGMSMLYQSLSRVTHIVLTAIMSVFFS